MKYGKLPARPERLHRDLRYAAYRTAALPKPPRVCDHSGIVSDWGMLANDEWGDCVFAGAAHETMVWTSEGLSYAAFTSDAVLSDYSAVTGFVKGDPITDRGTDVRQALLYRQKTGVVDGAGLRHKLGAFVAIAPANVQQVMECVYLFSCVAVGLRMPQSADQQFARGQPWKPVAGSPITGGHYVPVVGYRRYVCGGPYLACVTWGKVQWMSSDFFTAYNDESWALLSEEMLKAGKSPEGFDLPQLQADLAAVQR